MNSDAMDEDIGRKVKTRKWSNGLVILPLSGGSSPPPSTKDERRERSLTTWYNEKLSTPRRDRLCETNNL